MAVKTAKVTKRTKARKSTKAITPETPAQLWQRVNKQGRVDMFSKYESVLDCKGVKLEVSTGIEEAAWGSNGRVCVDVRDTFGTINKERIVCSGTTEHGFCIEVEPEMLSVLSELFAVASQSVLAHHPKPASV